MKSLRHLLTIRKKIKYSSTEFRQRLFALEDFRNKMLAFMHNYDVLICPVAATPARLHGETPDHLLDFSYVQSYSLTGWPVTVISCGTSKEGLPIGIQIVSKPWREDISLAVALRLQKHFGVRPVVNVENKKLISA